MSEQFPRVYFGSKEGGCLWEEAVVTEAKTKKPSPAEVETAHAFLNYISP